MYPTKEQVWNLSVNHPKFIEEMPEGSPLREAIRPFIESSVDVLEDMFDMSAGL